MSRSQAILSMEMEPEYEYDVFLSFRGSDTRLTFTDCLYHRMIGAGIRVFLDSEELEDGEKISEGLLKALNESRIYIPIFSRNFASSSWCLREVANIVEFTSKSHGKKEIIPIFYDVETDDVKLKTNLYKKAILEHEKKFGSVELKRWESALAEVGGRIGRDLKGERQGKIIESIVKEVWSKLRSKFVDVPEYLVEDHCQVKAIIELLDVNSDGVRFIGIHGLGGIGKTTLSRVVFNKLSPHFDGVCFLDDVCVSSQLNGTQASSQHGLINLQKKLLSSFVGPMITDQIKDIGGGMNWIKRVCHDKKVLLVLDNLDKKEQLQKLAGKFDWFGSGSRIIITTRDKSILKTQVKSTSEEVINQTEKILSYEVHVMEFDRALELFYKHAFRSESPIEDYVDLSKRIVHKVARLPLAVEVIGSFLYCDDSDLGQPSDEKKVWEHTLKRLDEGAFLNVRDVLMISYDGLETKHKEVFLDIACFFTNEDQTYPVIMWDDCNYYPPFAIRVLRQRSLIKIRDDNKFWMHDQVQDLGRYIILEEYPRKTNPRKFSRVWIHDDAVKLLKTKEKNEDVKVLSLTSDGCSRNFGSEELATLPNLRFLRVKGIDFIGNFENRLLELRWLSWEITHKEFRAGNLHFASLVVLDLSRSDIEDDWGGWSQIQMTNKLKVLDITGCTKLTRTPDFSNFMSLEMLVLARCPKLITIDSSICKLQRLNTLNIQGCSSIGELPEEVGSLQSLTQIIMPRNFLPLRLPRTLGNLKSLTSFILDEHPQICQLPDSIGGLVKLTCLSLRLCIGIKELPNSIGELKMLVKLDVSQSGIVVLPYSIGKLKKLKVMRIGYTKIKKFPRSITGLEMLEELDARKCWNLTDENLEEIEKLSNLRILDLSYTSVSRLPRGISSLSHLQRLEVGSIKLQQVPAFPSSLENLTIQAMDFSSVDDPSSLAHLKNLELYRLSALRKEPHSTWEEDLPIIEAALAKKQPTYHLPSHLSALRLKGISLLPDFSNTSNLTVLHAMECPISELPLSPNLQHLRELNICKCESLEKITGLSLLKSLERLELNCLDMLVDIQGLSELKSLQYLRLSTCHLLGRLPNLSKLSKLHHLELEACPKVGAIEGIKGLESRVLDSHGRTILQRLLDVPTPTWICHRLPIYDVFLSFRGLDTRYSIVNIIHYRIICSRISVYRDDEELRSGEGTGEQIRKALENSNFYIPVFSKNYASSKWCLRELAYMVKCTSKSEGKRRIIPIFYDVEIDDVKLKTNLYRRALDKHRKHFDHEEVKEWEDALKEVAPMSGFPVKTNSLTEVADLVIKEVLREKKLLDDDS